MAPKRINRGVRGFVGLAFGTPLDRILDLPRATQLGAALGGLLAAILSIKAFLFMVALIFATQWLDYVLGSRRAHREGTWSDELARDGRIAKIGELVLLLIVRGMEAAIMLAVPGLNTHGALATAAALALWRHEAQSAEANALALGGRGVPFLSPVLTAVGALEAWLIARLSFIAHPAPPPSPAPAPHERGGEG